MGIFNKNKKKLISSYGVPGEGESLFLNIGIVIILLLLWEISTTVILAVPFSWFGVKFPFEIQFPSRIEFLFGIKEPVLIKLPW